MDNHPHKYWDFSIIIFIFPLYLFYRVQYFPLPLKSMFLGHIINTYMRKDIQKEKLSAYILLICLKTLINGGGAKFSPSAKKSQYIMGMIVHTFRGKCLTSRWNMAIKSKELLLQSIYPKFGYKMKILKIYILHYNV